VVVIYVNSWLSCLCSIKVLADVFGAPVYTLGGTKNAACLGGAYIAKCGKAFVLLLCFIVTSSGTFCLVKSFTELVGILVAII